MTTFTRTWDAAYEDIPEDDDDALEGAMRIRHVKEDLRERLEVDHSWNGDAHDGKHSKVTLRPVSAPTLEATEIAVYAKVVSGKTQLFCKDQDGNEIQLTAGGTVSAFPTGVVLGTYATVAPTGWVLMNDGTIGSASSGATTRANADTEALYTLIWNNVSNTYAPVSSGRGASAAADFAANKTIALPKVLGRALAAAGVGAGLTARSLGETLGEEAHLLTAAESGLRNHAHSYLRGGIGPNGGNGWTGSGINGPDATGGSGDANALQAHNNMQPTSFLNYIIKL